MGISVRCPVTRSCTTRLWASRSTRRRSWCASTAAASSSCVGKWTLSELANSYAVLFCFMLICGCCSSNVGNVYMYINEGAVGMSGFQKPACRRIAACSLPVSDRCLVSRIRICPTKKHLAVGTLRGALYVAQLDLTPGQQAAKRITFKHHIKDHQQQEAEVNLCHVLSSKRALTGLWN